jgi:hypothetical protein
MPVATRVVKPDIDHHDGRRIAFVPLNTIACDWPIWVTRLEFINDRVFALDFF